MIMDTIKLTLTKEEIELLFVATGDYYISLKNTSLKEKVKGLKQLNVKLLESLESLEAENNK